MKYTRPTIGQSTDRPLITVITPYYNNPEIEETIHSVQRQTYPRIQYIVVDDGSPSVPPETVSVSS